MPPKQLQESLPVAQLVQQETSTRMKPYTLEEFSYDFFRYKNSFKGRMDSCSFCLLRE